MCSIDAESRHLLQPFRPADAGLALDLDGVPVQAEMAASADTVVSSWVSA